MLNYYVRPFVTAIIVAAGNSSRMGKNINKQFIKINNIPAIVHTILAFENSLNINTIIIVCKEENKQELKQLCDEFNLKKVFTIVKGGKTRQESVFKGISCAIKKTTHFAIHDGARILIRPNDIDKVVSDAIKYKAAVLGVMQKDTLKIIDKNNMIKATADRNYLWCAQTPQVFEKSLYIDAMNKALKENLVFTDDCQLIENLHIPIKVTKGSYDNIKITTPEDIIIAEEIIKKRCVTYENRAGV